jgi:hypothetical protein
MAVGFPAKTNFATGDVLTATNANDITGTLNLLQSTLYPAGRNKIINGDFGVNQRAFTTQTNGTGTTGFDKFKMNGINGTSTFTAQTFTPGTAPVAGYEATNFLRIVTTGQTLTTAETDVFQNIEDVRTFAGQTILISFWAKANSGTPKIATELRQSFGSGGSTLVSTPVGSSTISTSWARYSLAITVPSVSAKTIGTSSYLALVLFVSAGTSLDTRASSIGIQSNTFDIWGIQVEAASTGSTASPFQTASGSIQGELALCQRYCQYVGVSGVGMWFSTTTCQITWPLAGEMRTSPSITMTTTSPVISDAGVANRTGSGSTVSADTLTSSSIKANIDGFTAAVAGRVAQVNTNRLILLEADL